MIFIAIIIFFTLVYLAKINNMLYKQSTSRLETEKDIIYTIALFIYSLDFSVQELFICLWEVLIS